MNKALKYSLIAILALVLLGGAFSGGVLTGYFAAGAKGQLSVPGLATPILPQPGSGSGGTSSTPADVQGLFAPFWEAWDLLHQRYVDQPLDDTALMQGAIRGMLASLGDQHTSYMDPNEYKDANTALDGSFEGIGAYVDTSGDYLSIISPISGSPAEAAGLQSGDKIIAIDGVDMTGVAPDLARRKVLGPAGTKVKLTILRQGQDQPFDVEIIRAKIVVPSVESKMLDNNLGYVKINTFGQTTTQELKDALSGLMAKNPRGLILDVRNNGGGYLDTAVGVASQFIKQGQVVLYEKYGDGKRDEYRTEAGGLATDIPMVMLVNEGSASASEILAGALQDYGRAKLVGVTTYGKGSVQIWTPLSNNQGAVRITIAKWLTPKERAIHKIGLTPDYFVPMTLDDIKAKRDPQLDEAIQVLESILSGNILPTPTIAPTATATPVP